MPSQPSSTFRNSIIALILFVVLIVTGIYFLIPSIFNTNLLYLEQKLGIAPPVISITNPIADISLQAWTGDLRAAGDHARSLAQTAPPNSRTQFESESLASIAELSTSAESARRTATIHSLIQSFEASSSSAFSKAWNLNKITVAISTGEPYLLQEVASSSLASYVVPEDVNLTVYRLAVHSYDIYPTSQSAFIVSTYYANDISANYQQKNSARVLARSKAILLDWYAKGTNLVATELPYVKSSSIGITYVPWTTLQQAKILGAVALIDPSYTPQALQLYTSIYTYNENTRDAQGNTYALVLQPVAEAHLYMARQLYLIDSKKYKTDIKEQLALFVSTIQKDPSIQQMLFVVLDQIQHSSLNATSTATNLSYTYNLYATLATISPEFKVFLIGRGWKLDTK